MDDGTGSAIVASLIFGFFVGGIVIGTYDTSIFHDQAMSRGYAHMECEKDSCHWEWNKLAAAIPERALK